jgi:hypothetical protein
MMYLVAVRALLLGPLREGWMDLRQAGMMVLARYVMEIRRIDSLVRKSVCVDGYFSSSFPQPIHPRCAFFLYGSVLHSLLTGSVAVCSVLLAS